VKTNTYSDRDQFVEDILARTTLELVGTTTNPPSLQTYLSNLATWLKNQFPWIKDRSVTCTRHLLTAARSRSPIV